jgi:hypothetical protein
VSHASRIRSCGDAPCIALVVKACPRILDCPAPLNVGPWSRLCSNSPKLMVQRTSLGSRWSGTLFDGNGRVVLKSSGISNGVEADSTARLCVRGGVGAAREIPMRQATEDLFRDVLPWRTFRWYYGQQHYSGSYWASTMSAHVIYESRLELARLLMADFDTSVNHIVAPCGAQLCLCDVSR